MGYIKQLDTLRAFAVIMVIISHWGIGIPNLNLIPIGHVGVDIFFVLSGFLITGILLENRQKADTENASKRLVTKNFYVRRTLRIFPIYYLTIIVFFILKDYTGAATGAEGSLIYYLTYTSNFYFVDRQIWDGMLSHLWSLAVEEQFYLLWPWLMLFVGRRFILPLIITFILIGVASQYLLINIQYGDILTFACFDAFGIGGLLAWILRHEPEALKKAALISGVVSILGLTVVLYGLVSGNTEFIPTRTIVSTVTFWFICSVINGLRNDNLKFKFILNSAPLVFLGKISYGIYLYHHFIPTLNLHTINKFLNPMLPAILTTKYLPQLLLVENSIVLVVAAWLSFRLIEKPFLNLKKYFEYTKKPGP